MRKLYIDLQSIAMVTKRGTRISQSNWTSFTTNMKDLCRQLLESEESTVSLEISMVSHALTVAEGNTSNCFTPIRDDEAKPPTHEEKRMLSLEMCTPENQQIPTLKTPAAPKRLKLDTISSKNISDNEDASEQAKTCRDDTKCKTYNTVNNECFHLGQPSFLRCSNCNPIDYNNW